MRELAGEIGYAVGGAWLRSTLYTPDWATVQRFYEHAFEWETDQMAPDAPVAITAKTGERVATCEPPPAGWPSPERSLWVTFFAVANLDQSIEHALSLGASDALRLTPNASAALLVDNHGALFGTQATK